MQDGQPVIESIQVDDRRRVRLVTRPLMDGDRVLAVVRIGESLQAIDQAVADLMRPLVVGGALVLLVCSVATWVVVSRALEGDVNLSFPAKGVRCVIVIPSDQVTSRG